MGDKNEAIYYCYFAHQVWHETTGVIDWIKKNKRDRTQNRKIKMHEKLTRTV
ncbi:MAG: hypothetical protein GYA51_01785 [Candidatus Methanofastidiosa archaeon]|nr:hypothetical protein [Candidatus Methanofastidiosa archaeon]